MNSAGLNAFGPVLRGRRHEAGLTQEELAERAGLSVRAISDLERGVAQPYQKTVARLANALGLTGTGRAEFVHTLWPSPGGTGPVRDRAVPRQLPAAATDFTGRAAELQALDGLLERGDEPPGTVVVSAIDGTAGVGKTALAVHWAHQVAGRFPDGQLYVNLRGYDPGQPMPPADALAGFLRALGVPGRDIPADTEERAARYRSLVAGRRVLVLLDNAGSVDQVRPLLPGAATCLALVTSRDTLAGLAARDGARRLDLDLLPPADANVLLTSLIGDRATADPEATAALAGACARLPLALRVAAEMAADQTGVPLRSLVTELSDQQRRLDLLEAGGDSYTAVRAVFSWSYQHLDDDAACVFRRLGLHPGREVEPYCVAALSGGTLDQAHRHLHRLARAHLIHPTHAGRYGQHDLLRAYAAELAVGEDGPAACHAALTRLFDYYLHTAAAAADALYPASERAPEGPAAPGPIPPVAIKAEARAWLESQLTTLVAMTGPVADPGVAGHIIRLSQILSSHLYVGGHYAESVIIHDRAATAARRSGDIVAEAKAISALSLADLHRGQFDEAASHLRWALRLWRRIGDRSGEASALSYLGLTKVQQGQFGQATSCYQHSMALHRELGDWVQLADVLGNLSLVEIRQGRYRDAAAHLREALALAGETEDQGSDGYAVAHLGITEFLQGRYPRAIVLLERALGLFRKDGHPVGEAYALTYLGALASRQGRPAEAIGHLRQALSLCRQIGEKVSELEAINVLGDVYVAAGRLHEARAQYVAGLSLATDLGERYEQARAHDGLGQVWFAAGDHGQARPHWEQALALYADLGTPQAETVRARLESC